MNKSTMEDLGIGITDVTSSAYVSNSDTLDKSESSLDNTLNRTQDKGFNNSHFGFVNGGITKKDANMVKTDEESENMTTESGKFFSQMFKKDDWGKDLDPRTIRLNRYTYKIELQKEGWVQFKKGKIDFGSFVNEINIWTDRFNFADNIKGLWRGFTLANGSDWDCVYTDDKASMNDKNFWNFINKQYSELFTWYRWNNAYQINNGKSIDVILGYTTVPFVWKTIAIIDFKLFLNHGEKIEDASFGCIDNIYLLFKNYASSSPEAALPIVASSGIFFLTPNTGKTKYGETSLFKKYIGTSKFLKDSIIYDENPLTHIENNKFIVDEFAKMNKFDAASFDTSKFGCCNVRLSTYIKDSLNLNNIKLEGYENRMPFIKNAQMKLGLLCKSYNIPFTVNPYKLNNHNKDFIIIESKGRYSAFESSSIFTRPKSLGDDIKEKLNEACKLIAEESKSVIDSIKVDYGVNGDFKIITSFKG